MLYPATAQSDHSVQAGHLFPQASLPAAPASADGKTFAFSSAETLRLLQEGFAPKRRVVFAGDPVCRAGDRFDKLHVVSAGLFKVLETSADGCEQITGLRFRGDWLGFDGIAGARYSCDTVAMDTGEIWEVGYDALISATAGKCGLLRLMHRAMGREMAADRASFVSVRSLPAYARVVDFLRFWIDSRAIRGMRTDQITLPMTRAELGNYLGMTLETVSRVLSKLAREHAIEFADKGHREICIPHQRALLDFVRRRGPPEALLQ